MVSWFKGATVYHILIDRFTGTARNPDTPTFYGGTIRGITEKLGYIQDLGFDALWISPFNQSESYHGYNITDYENVHKRFGTERDLAELIQEVHKRGMHIIADFVPNHCSNKHPFFEDAVTNQSASRYKDWFYFKNGRSTDNDYLKFMDYDELPKLNLENEETADYMIKVAEHWLNLGLDGYRIDAVVGVPMEFLKRLRETVPEAVLIGEAWVIPAERIYIDTFRVPNASTHLRDDPSEPAALYKEYVGFLDGVLDFRFRKLLNAFVGGKLTGPELDLELSGLYNSFPDDFYFPAFVDNHDVDRFMFRCGNNLEKFLQGLEILTSLPQPIIIYYGTEAGMTQPRTIKGMDHGDLFARQPMSWDNRENQTVKSIREKIRARSSSQ